MAIVSAGYAGTVNDLQWAKLSRYFGIPQAVKGLSDCAVTQQGSTKTFNVAAGEFYSAGILDTSDAIVNVAPTVPGSGGQWFLLVARRVWATKTTSFVVVASSTTTTTPPAAPPAALPSISTNPGVQEDQPLAWVWVNASNTTVVIFDLRVRADLNFKGQVPTYPNVYARDAANPVPSLGDLARDLSTGIIRRYDGSLWQVWTIPRTAFTPSFTNLTLGTGGSVAAFYWVKDGLLGIELRATLGSGAFSVGDVQFASPGGLVLLPNTETFLGGVNLRDISVAQFPGALRIASGGMLRLFSIIVSGSNTLYSPLSSTTPFIWAAGDLIVLVTDGIPIS